MTDCILYLDKKALGKYCGSFRKVSTFEKDKVILVFQYRKVKKMEQINK